jgi:hypothetical protein
MRLLRRIVGIAVLLLSTVGIVCCIAGIIGIWTVYQEVAERTQRISDRLDAGLERASLANQNVRDALGKARADVANVDKESADLAGGGEKGRRASRAVRTLIQQKAGPDIDDFGGRLATLSESAVAVSSLLQSFQEVPLGENIRVDPEPLQRRAAEAHQLSVTLRRLEPAVGDADGEIRSEDLTAATSQVDVVLSRCEEAVDRWQSDLNAARESVARIKARVLGWLKWSAIALTVLLAWVGLGQISLFGRAVRWCRGA